MDIHFFWQGFRDQVWENPEKKTLVTQAKDLVNEMAKAPQAGEDPEK